MAEAAPLKPTGFIGTRHRQICIIFFGLVISYIQRVNLSVGLVAMANPPVSSKWPAIEYSTYQKGVLSGIFYWGYLVGGMPAGYVADKYSPVKLVSIVGGIMCGVMTMATPYIIINWGFEAVCAARVLEGFGNAVFYPSTQAFLSKWAIPQERESFSWVWSGAQLGTVIMMALGGLLAESPGGWPAIFYFSGAMSIVWGLFCFTYGADCPALHKTMSNQEKKYIEVNCQASSKKMRTMKIPFKAIATSIPVYALLTTHACEAWGYSLLITLMPTYLTGVFGFDVAQNGLLSAMPYLVMFICSYLFAFLASHLRKLTSVNFSRKFWNSVGQYGTAIVLLLLAFIDASAVWALVFLVLTNALDAGQYSGFLSNHLDLAPNYAGFLLGMSNSLGNICAIVSPTVAGYVVKDEHNVAQWQILFLVSAIVRFVGNTVFLIFGSTSTQPWNDPEYLNTPKTERNAHFKECE